MTGTPESPQAPALQEQITSKESELQGEGESIVDEAAVGKAVSGIQDQIQKSPVSPSHKQDIQDKFGELLGRREAEIGEIDQSDQLKKVVTEIQAELKEFDESTGLKEAQKLFENREGVAKAMNLKQYKRGSGHWNQINEEVKTLTGLDQPGIAKVQRLLQIEDDGKIGPQTINALAEFLDVGGLSAEFADETVEGNDDDLNFNMNAGEEVYDQIDAAAMEEIIKDHPLTALLIEDKDNPKFAEAVTAAEAAMEGLEEIPEQIRRTGSPEDDLNTELERIYAQYLGEKGLVETDTEEPVPAEEPPEAPEPEEPAEVVEPTPPVTDDVSSEAPAPEPVAPVEEPKPEEAKEEEEKGRGKRTEDYQRYIE
jgi:hypothetical protein